MPRMLAASTVALALFVAAGPSAQARQAAAQLSVDEKVAFLESAKIVASRPIGKGVTGALRLTLSDGTLTHDASFQSVDQRNRPGDMRFGRPPAGELLFVDSYLYNIAAWEIARLLGLEEMMPPTVARSYQARRGALSWWVDDVLMDEAERERTAPELPEGASLRIARDRQRMQVFSELVRDTDRNKGNVLYLNDWRLVMIDFTRAFRLQPELRLPDTLITCDRDLLARLRALDRQAVQRAAGDHLSPFEIGALLKRRDLIVERFDRLVAQRGESAVLF